MKRILSLHRQGKTDKAISMINSLIDKTTESSENGINTWHEQQVLGLKTIIYQETARTKEAAESELEVIALNQSQLTYWGRALANSLAVAASLNFDAGRNRVAAKLAKEAIQKAKRFKESNSIIKAAEVKLKRYEKQQNPKRKSKRAQQVTQGDGD